MTMLVREMSMACFSSTDVCCTHLVVFSNREVLLLCQLLIVVSQDMTCFNVKPK